MAQFYLLDDDVTGVLALGSFADDSYEVLLDTLLNGLVDLKKRGAKRLIVDVVRSELAWSENRVGSDWMLFASRRTTEEVSVPFILLAVLCILTMPVQGSFVSHTYVYVPCDARAL